VFGSRRALSASAVPISRICALVAASSSRKLGMDGSSCSSVVGEKPTDLLNNQTSAGIPAVPHRRGEGRQEADE
jgi:hypothetical protein